MNITKTSMLYNDYGEEKDKMIEIHDPLICHHEISYAYTTPLSFLFRGANGLISFQLFTVANSCCLNDYQGIRAPSVGP